MILCKRPLVFLLCALAVLLQSSMTMAGFPVKSQNPFALMAAVPELHVPLTYDRARWSYRALVTLSNHWYLGKNKHQRLWLDTESVVMSNRWTFYQDNIQFYIDLPYIHYGGGFLDEFLSNYHQWLDLPNGDREKYPDDQNHLKVTSGDKSYQVYPRSGIGDPVLGIGWQFFESAFAQHSFLTRIKAGLASPRRLLGNGAWSISHCFSHQWMQGFWSWHLQYGVMFQQAHEYFGWRRQAWVGLGSFAGFYQLDAHWRIGVQYDYYSSLYRNTKLIPPGESHMGTLGVIWEGEKSRWHWALQEDLVVGTAADVSFQWGYQHYF